MHDHLAKLFFRVFNFCECLLLFILYLYLYINTIRVFVHFKLCDYFVFQSQGVPLVKVLQWCQQRLITQNRLRTDSEHKIHGGS